MTINIKNWEYVAAIQCEQLAFNIWLFEAMVPFHQIRNYGKF